MTVRVRAAGVWILVAGCSFPDQLPKGVIATCTTDVDCPLDQTCEKVVQRCFSKARTDTTAPVVVTSLITPTVGNAGARFNIQFRTDEPLAAQPSMVLFSAATGIAVDGGGAWVAPNAEREFHFVFRPPQSEAAAKALQGQVAAVATLTDLSGNSATYLVGSFELDVTPPQVAATPVPVLRIVSGADNLLDSNRVEALTFGSVGLLTFSVSEPLTEVGVVTSEPSLRVRPGPQSDVQFQFAVEVAPDQQPPPMADVSFVVHGSDRAQNALDAGFGLRLRLDTQAPTAPVDAGLLFVRRPWGDPDAGSPRAFSLQAPEGALEPFASVAVRDVGAQIPFAQGQANAQGSLNLTLGQVDRPTVELAVLDTAGNSSGWFRQRDIRLEATLFEKIPGLRGPNPNRVEAWPAGVRGTRNAAAVERTLEAGLTATTAASWRQRTLTVPACGQLVEHRRNSAVTLLNHDGSIQEWNGSDWVSIATIGSASCGFMPWVAVWDESREVLLKVCSGLDVVHELERGRWRTIPTSVAATGAVAWAPQMRRVMMVAPRTGATATQFLWGWNGSDWAIHESAPMAAAALAREGEDGLLAVSDVGGVRVLRAGLWSPELDGGLPLNAGQQLRTHDVTGRPWLTALGGGQPQVWTGTAWQRQVALPSVCAAAADPGQGSMLGIDSVGRTYWLDEDGGARLAASGVLKPGALIWHAATYASGRGEVAILAADAGASNLYFWNGVRFASGRGLPVPRPQAGLAEDPTSGSLVLFGGGTATDSVSDETWVLRDDAGAWSKLDFTGQTNPLGRAAFAMAYCPPLEGLLIQGGATKVRPASTTTANTQDFRYWLLKSDAGWSQSLDATQNSFHQAWYEPGGSSCYLGWGRSVGGFPASEIWQINIDGGSRGATVPLPDLGHGYGLAVDPISGRAVFAGGTQLGIQTGWLRPGGQSPPIALALADPEGDGDPLPRTEHTLSADQRRGVLVMAGGRLRDGTISDELWELTASDHAAALVFFVDLSSIDTRGSLQSLRVLGRVDQSAAVELFAGSWRRVRWVAPGTGFSLSVGPDAGLQRLFHGQSELAVRFSSDAGHRPDSPVTLTVSQPEVWLEYRIP